MVKSQVTNPCKYVVAPWPLTEKIRRSDRVSFPRRQSLPKLPAKDVTLEDAIFVECGDGSFEVEDRGS